MRELRTILTGIGVFFILGFIEQYKQAQLNHIKYSVMVHQYVELMLKHQGKQTCVHLDGTREDFQILRNQLDHYRRDTLYHYHWMVKPEIRAAVHHLTNQKRRP